jgi:microcystin degradation protein MlrC
MSNALNYFWIDGGLAACVARNAEDAAVLRVIASCEDVSGGLTGNQCTVIEAAVRRELRQASKAAINPSLDEALNSGAGVYRP